MFKVGLELFTAVGAEAGADQPARARLPGPQAHDIPNTVEHAARNCARLGVRILTVHALGGEAMIAAAVRGAHRGARSRGCRPRRSRPSPCCRAWAASRCIAGVAGVRAMSAGATGAVVSGDDVSMREVVDERFCLIVPGIRRIERVRPGPGPHAGGGRGGGRRLPRHRPADHRVAGSRGDRAHDPLIRSLNAPIRTKPQVACMHTRCRARGRWALYSRSFGPHTTKERRMPLPVLTDEQRKQALEKAAEVRAASGRDRGALKSNKMALKDLLSRPTTTPSAR